MADVLTFSEAHTTSRGQHSNERLTHSSVKGTELEILRGTWDRQGKKFSLSAAFTARHTAFRWPSGVLCSAVRSNLDFGTIPVPSTLPPCAGRRLASAPWYFFLTRTGTITSACHAASYLARATPVIRRSLSLQDVSSA